ncbi:hypothetical protein B296_00046904 [Ensete ventricosum]|uniref:BHLH domain-containing protein n=1 Tax=Ensete ventricosum TaxID=4639 RepID=A0A426X9X7_ENSVE|nr:hypothetical protein B296_00046904 [Ensete ventricosum]
MPWSPSAAAPPENDRAAAVLSPNLMSLVARAAARRHLGLSGSRDSWALRALLHPKLQAARLKQQEREREEEASFWYMVKWLNHAPPPSRGVINASVPLGYADMQRKKKVYARPLEMSSRRSSRITDEEISELISKLQSLLPESRRRSMSRVSNPAAITPLRQSLLSATICDCLPHVASVFDAWAHICMQASAAKLLKETCSYIKSLHREVDDLSDRLSDLMSSMDSGSPQADIIRSILRS